MYEVSQRAEAAAHAIADDMIRRGAKALVPWRSIAQTIDNITREAVWSSLHMVREALEETGPAASLESSDAVLLRGPEPQHEAEAIIDAIGRLTTYGREQRTQGFREGAEAMKNNPQFCWVIERYGSPPDAPAYYAPGSYTLGNENDWTTDFGSAEKYGTYAEANERAKAMLGGGNQHRICEHGTLPTPPDGESGEATFASANGMTALLGDVRAFHEACDVPVGLRTAIVQERVQLRRDILEEEWRETDSAMERGDLIELADGLADVIYVAVGTALEFGIPLDRVWAEVQRSNMAKRDPVTGKVRRREDGKVLKPEGWTPPDIARAIEANMKEGG